MANVGDQLTQPEAGWRRYDDNNSLIRIIGFSRGANGSFYDGGYTLINSMPYPYNGTQNFVEFSFKGTKLRIISSRSIYRSNNIKITIDGTVYRYDTGVSSGEVFQVVAFELIGLDNKEHHVVIQADELTTKKNVDNTIGVELDAIDIDSTGELLSISPATTGKLCNTLEEMEIGDYIVLKYAVATNSYQFGGSTEGYTEIPVTGYPWVMSNLPNCYWYMIKTDIGILVADRVIRHSVSWDALNSTKLIQGSTLLISGISGQYRSLTGGVAYADETGNKSFVNKTKGCFPTNNEWDKYIKGLPSKMIQQGKRLNDVWNHDKGVSTWTQDTTANGMYTSSTGANTSQVTSTFSSIRGGDSLLSGVWGGFGIYPSNTTLADCGFRPVFEYKEV